MNPRTAQHSITFAKPFAVTGVEQEQPAGTYLIETDDELIEGLSFSAYRRTSTRIRLAAVPQCPGIEEIVEINCPFITARLAAEAARDD